jgi:iron transport multicopper oxidase
VLCLLKSKCIILTIYRASFNNITYIAPKVPSLYTAISAGKDALNPIVYGSHTNSHIVKQGQIVEIVVNNFDGGSHPIHCTFSCAMVHLYFQLILLLVHGHVMQFVARGDLGSNPAITQKVPMRRDTWLLAPSATNVFRYKADNPGVWLLHCHMEWHVEAGLTATIIEAPLQIQQGQSYIPNSMKNICKSQNIPIIGNAAGNSKNFTDLTGENVVATIGRGSVYP